MNEKTNTTVQDAIKYSWGKQMMKFGESPSWFSSASITWKDDTLSERHEDLLERFPSKGIGDIRKLENILKIFNGSDKDEICEICLENDIIPDEILLMDVMFKNNLQSASRDGISILDIDGSFEIRNGENKFLSGEDVELLKEYMKESKEYKGYVDQGPGNGGGGISGFQGGNTTTTSNGGGGRDMTAKAGSLKVKPNGKYEFKVVE